MIFCFCFFNVVLIFLILFLNFWILFFDFLSFFFIILKNEITLIIASICCVKLLQYRFIIEVFRNLSWKNKKRKLLNFAIAITKFETKMKKTTKKRFYIKKFNKRVCFNVMFNENNESNDKRNKRYMIIVLIVITKKQ